MRINILGILKISMASLFILGCSSGGSDDETVEPINNDVIPTNLSLSINLTGSDVSNPNGDGTGQANFQVSASNAVRYAVKIDNNPLIESNSGSISYTFNDDGTNTYIVSAFAYSSTDNSISTFKSVIVFVGNEPGYQLVWSDEFNIDGAIDFNLSIPSATNGQGQTLSELLNIPNSNGQMSDFHGEINLNNINDNCKSR